jgi:hypothetical protein
MTGSSFEETWEKTMPKGNSKMSFFDSNGDKGLPASTYLLIIDVSVQCRKTVFL